MNLNDIVCEPFFSIFHKFYLELSRFRDEIGGVASVSADFHLAGRCRYFFQIFFSTIYFLCLSNCKLKIKLVERKLQSEKFCVATVHLFLTVYSHSSTSRPIFTSTPKVDFRDNTVLGSNGFFSTKN